MVSRPIVPDLPSVLTMMFPPPVLDRQSPQPAHPFPPPCDAAVDWPMRAASARGWRRFRCRKSPTLLSMRWQWFAFSPDARCITSLMARSAARRTVIVVSGWVSRAATARHTRHPEPLLLPGPGHREVQVPVRLLVSPARQGTRRGDDGFPYLCVDLQGEVL